MKKILITLLALLPTFALAHAGHTHDASFSTGFMHPLTGLDHLFVMLAVGLWSALSFNDNKKIMTAPLSFATAMVIGALLGIVGISFFATEQLIIASMVVIGLLLALSLKLNVFASSALVAAFALFHGMAHGTEMPATGSTTMYIIGFTVATVLIHIVGITFGLFTKNRAAWLARIGGLFIFAFGTYSLIA